jgi:hypothetical protein
MQDTLQSGDFNDQLYRRERLAHPPPQTDQAETIEYLHSVWKQVRGPFLVPEICHTCGTDDWENFDVDKAGCTKCGRLHACVLQNCHAEETRSHFVCPITGFVTKKAVFQNTIVIDRSQEVMNALPHRRWVCKDQVECIFRNLTRSDTWNKCMCKESRRINMKMSNMFQRVAKEWKADGKQPNIVNMFTEVRNRMGYIRIPVMNLDNKDYNYIMGVCVDHIIQFTHTFRKQLSALVPMAKIHSLIIGLIYMLRQGIVIVNSLVILPQIPILRQILPMETCLKTYFQIPCKIITETENLVKNMLKKIKRQSLMEIVNTQYHSAVSNILI